MGDRLRDSLSVAQAGGETAKRSGPIEAVSCGMVPAQGLNEGLFTSPTEKAPPSTRLSLRKCGKRIPLTFSSIARGKNRRRLKFEQ